MVVNFQGRGNCDCYLTQPYPTAYKHPCEKLRSNTKYQDLWTWALMKQEANQDMFPGLSASYNYTALGQLGDFVSIIFFCLPQHTWLFQRVLASTPILLWVGHDNRWAFKWHAASCSPTCVSWFRWDFLLMILIPPKIIREQGNLLSYLCLWDVQI